MHGTKFVKSVRLTTRNDQIRMSIIEKDVAYCHYRRTRSEADLVNFRRLRNRATQTVCRSLLGQ